MCCSASTLVPCTFKRILQVYNSIVMVHGTNISPGHCFYPTLGFLRGLIYTGFSEEDAVEIKPAMWEFAPEEMRSKLCKVEKQSLAA